MKATAKMRVHKPRDLLSDRLEKISKDGRASAPDPECV